MSNLSKVVAIFWDYSWRKYLTFFKHTIGREEKEEGRKEGRQERMRGKQYHPMIPRIN